MSAKRQAIKDEFKHESLENIKANLKKINEKLASQLINDNSMNADDLAIQKELKKAETWKQGKADKANETLQNNNIKK